MAERFYRGPLSRSELLGRAEALGVFEHPDDYSDEQLRDAIAAEEACASFVDRLEQLPTDEAKRDAIHRLRLGLETEAARTVADGGRPQTARGRRLLFESQLPEPEPAPACPWSGQPFLFAPPQPLPPRELPAGEVLAYLSQCAMCGQRALTRSQWGGGDPWLCTLCNGNNELTVHVQRWLPGAATQQRSTDNGA